MEMEIYIESLWLFSKLMSLQLFFRIGRLSVASHLFLNLLNHILICVFWAVFSAKIVSYFFAIIMIIKFFWFFTFFSTYADYK